MAITWTDSGHEYTASEEQRAQVAAEIGRLDFKPLPQKNVPFAQGMAIKMIMQGLGKNGFTHAAWNGVVFDSYGLYGLRTDLPRQVTYSYWLDCGDSTVCLAFELIEKEEGRDGDSRIV